MTSPALSAVSRQLAQLYKIACLAEIESLKPGNVHIFADGHGMNINDFVQSAEASSKVIARAELGLGERIFQSVEATWNVVACNTNLGIVLLCAPIIQAVLMPTTTSLHKQLQQVLASTSELDANWLFKAIRLANPAGLGEVDQYDVNGDAECTLLEAMQASAATDMICLQYSNDFYHVFEEGLPLYQETLARWERPAWAATVLYLYWLSQYPDSHIIRKYGNDKAVQIQEEAKAHFTVFHALDNPKNYLPELLTFDQSLKSRALNPGTSADLTVAALLLQNFAEIGFI